MQITPERINTLFKNFSTSHLLLNSYHNEAMSNIVASDLEYPLMWLVLDPFTLEQGIYNQKAKILFLDRGDEETIRTYSSMIQIAEDFQAVFAESEDKFGFNIKTEVSGEPIIMAYDDKASGVVIDIDIESRIYRNELEVPIDYDSLYNSENINYLIKDNYFYIVDDSDNTKSLNFDVSNLTSGTNRILTVQDKDGTIALLSDVDGSAALDVESDDRIAADELLQDNIDAEELARTNSISSLQAEVSQEIIDRETIDISLQSNIDAEAVLRANADTLLDDKIDSETSDRTTADTALNDLITDEANSRLISDGLLQDNIDGEITDRTTNYNLLEGQINSEIDRATAAEDVNTLSISNESGIRSSADTTLQSNINTEEANRIAADLVLQSNIDAIDTSGTSLVQTEINNVEINAGLDSDGNYIANTTSNYLCSATSLKDADDKLDAQIEVVDDNLTTEISNREAAITQEVTDRNSAIETEATALELLITNENTRAKTAETVNSNNISTESTNRIAADVILQDAINNEVTNRTASDVIFSDNIALETTNRTNADELLQSNIDNLTVEVDLNTAKVGITTTQASAIVDNTAKVSFDAVSSTRLANTSGNNTGDQDLSVYELSLPDTPDSPENKFLNGNKIFTEITLGSGGYASNLYMTNIASATDPSQYQTSYTNDLVQSSVSAVTSGSVNTLMASYLSDNSLGITTVDEGLWQYNFYGSINSSSLISTISVVLFKRDIAGIETDLFTITSNEINNTDDEWIVLQSIQPSYTVLSTDKLGHRVYFTTTSSVDKTFTYYIGDGYASYVTTPLSLKHSQLREKNGEAEYQHMSSAEKVVLDNTSGINTGDQDLSVYQPLSSILTNTTSSFTGTLYNYIIANNSKISYTDASAVALNTLKETNVVHPLVETAVPSNAVFTDTIYDDTTIQLEVDLNTAKISFDWNYDYNDLINIPITITTAQANEITANTAKIGITTTQAANILTNNDKISYTDASAVALNTLKVGYTDELVSANSAVAANTAKIGITTAQANAITANTNKISYTDAAAVALNTAKISFDSINSSRLANTSGTNTGDNAANSLYAGLLTDVKYETFSIACSDEDSDLETGTGVASFHMPFGMTITSVRACLNTAATGSTLIVDINEGGTSILSTKLSIDNSETSSVTATTSAIISDTTLADDSILTIDIDQVGSTVAGTGLKIFITGYRI